MTKENVYYWPLWLSKSLDKKDQSKLKKILPKIQRAQIFLWRALNIYDDFFDGAGQTINLTQANKYFRTYLRIHYDLHLSSQYYKNLHKIFDNLDKANSSEIKQAKLKIKNELIKIPDRLPPGKKLFNLSDKSLALALGPIALLNYLNYSNSSGRTRAVLNFFRYALAAKQLADDSHDWLEDLQHGLITNANRPILLTAKNRRLKLSIGKSPITANLLYSEVAAPLIISDLKKLCRLARRNLSKINKNPKNILIAKLISPIEVSALKAEGFLAQVVEKGQIML